MVTHKGRRAASAPKARRVINFTAGCGLAAAAIRTIGSRARGLGAMINRDCGTEE